MNSLRLPVYRMISCYCVKLLNVVARQTAKRKKLGDIVEISFSIDKSLWRILIWN